MLDAYTYTAAYPYSQPIFWQPGGIRAGGLWLNYIRNSVKIVVNAYDGSILFYVADPNDPIIQTYQRVFPSLFRPLSEMPQSLRAHVRYPEDLFKIQADRYLSFHMQDPTVFYNREDSWAVATEKVGSQNQAVDVEPYYVVMRMPGEAREEFLLMQPFTPVNRTNMIAWLAARSDEPNYGKLVVYKYPKERLIFGPFQVEGRIDQDPTISAQFALWSQSGTRVIRGNLLVIPLGASNLYVEPVYLQAENGPIPELKRVVVSTGSRVVMEPTLEEALARLFNLPAANVPSTGSTVTSAQAAAPAGGQTAAQAVPGEWRRRPSLRARGRHPVREPALHARPGGATERRLDPLRRGAAPARSGPPPPLRAHPLTRHPAVTSQRRRHRPHRLPPCRRHPDAARSARREAAVDRERLARDVHRVRPGQEREHPGHVVRHLRPAQRDRRDPPLPGLALREPF